MVASTIEQTKQEVVFKIFMPKTFNKDSKPTRRPLPSGVRPEGGTRKPAREKRESVPEPEPEPEFIPASFDELGLTDELRRAVTEAGFESPTPIQARSIPVLLTGKDLIGQAQTGTGKTAAFALPLLQRVDPKKNEVQALVMVPTRELAVQVAGQIHLLSKHTGLRVVPVYGGQPIDRQFRALKQGAHVVVGTPGRVQDHIRRQSLDLSKVIFCALDEADEMLAFGFIDDIEAILAELPAERQLALFSATMPSRIASLAGRFMPNAHRISIEVRRRTVDAIEQTYYEVTPGKKPEALARILATETYFAATQLSPAFTRLDSSASLGTYAGYSNRMGTVTPAGTPPFFALTPGAFVNPAFPTLDRTSGFTLSFTIRQNSQTSASPVRAGFSVILLGSDSLGVEIGFAGDTLFSQAPGFTTAAESVTGANITTLTGALTNYTLNITGNNYVLSTGNTLLLGGTIKDYTGATGFAGNIYRSTNFVFLGDDTTSASGNTDFAFVAISTAPEPTTGGLCGVLLASGGTLLVRRKHGLSKR